MEKKSGNRPSIFKPENQLTNVEPGDTNKYLSVSMKLATLPSVDLQDGEAVEQRVKEYFQIHADNDIKPTVMGLGLALGLDRRRLWEIKTGHNVGSSGKQQQLPPRTVDAVKKAYFIMENLWENYMQNGKINPVAGIFLAKNGDKDFTDINRFDTSVSALSTLYTKF